MFIGFRNFVFRIVFSIFLIVDEFLNFFVIFILKYISYVKNIIIIIIFLKLIDICNYGLIWRGLFKIIYVYL